MMKNLALCAAAFALLPATAMPVQGQVTSIDSPTLSEQIQAIRKSASLTAIGATVMVDGQVIAEAAVGERRQGSDVPVTVDDRWHIGSVTKSMTATVIAKLVERGELAWDATLPALLPEMSADFDSSWNDVHLHHLLTHTAGLPANFPVRVQFLRPESRSSLHETRRQELVAVLAEPARSPPGDRHSYSNIGYTLAGFIAAEKAGVPWETLMERELFVPLKLTSAGFGPPVGENELDQPWGHRRSLFVRVPADPKGGADNSPIIGPAGIIHMTMKDLAAYGWQHLHGETTPDGMLKADTFVKLHTPAAGDYGYGWVIWQRDWADGRLIWHNGSNTMWYTLLMLVPSRDAVIVVVTNDGNLADAQPAFFDLAESIVKVLPVVRKEGQ
ncbi:MAG: serine hydrolase domain-containing protein [Planctomycetaceae bacterium]